LVCTHWAYAGLTTVEVMAANITRQTVFFIEKLASHDFLEGQLHLTTVKM
jgi:hypothetical protein